MDGLGGDDFDIDSFDIEIPTDDATITQRRRALTPIQVVTDIERNKTLLEGDFWQHYDLFTISLAVIDQVALSMGISAGMSWDRALDYAAEQARRQRPQGPPADAEAVAARVLNELTTTSSEQIDYVANTADGPQWRSARFFLLTLHESADGGEHLRASDQAINIFLNALDIDLDAAQVALEAQMAALVARGAFASAVQVARAARYQSILKMGQVRRILADTAIDPNSHDWVSDVPQVLSAALVHVAERMAAEGSLLDAVAQRRAGLGDPDALVEANRLIELLHECRTRHSELHLHLIDARSRMRDSVEAHLSRPYRTSPRFGLAADLLEPGLSRSAAEFDQVVDTIVTLTGGARMSFWPTFACVVDDAFTRPEPPDPGVIVEDPDFDAVEPPRWWEPYDDLCERLTVNLTEPARLSVLCRRVVDAAGGGIVDDDGEPLDPAVAAAAMCHWAHASWSPALGALDDGADTAVAVRTGERFTLDVDGIVAVDAEDLLVVPVTIDRSERTAGSDDQDAHCDGDRALEGTR